MTMRLRHRLSTLALTLAFPMIVAPAPAATAGVAEDFAKFVDDYFAAKFAASPSAGTAAGLHEYDAKLEDPSRPKVEARIAELKGLLARLEAVEKAKLSFDEAID